MLLDLRTYRKDFKYPNPVKKAKPSDPDTWRGYGRAGTKTRSGLIKSILIHTTNNPNQNIQLPSEATFLLNSPDVSCNYIVSSQDTLVCQIVPDNTVAWHSGNCADDDYENDRSIGIEVVWAQGLGKIPDLAIQNLSELVRMLLHQYPSITKIDMHRAQAIPKGRKSDPAGWSDADFYAWRDSMFTPQAPNEITADTTIMGLPRCTEEQALKYLYRINPVTNQPIGTGDYTEKEVQSFVHNYFVTCINAGVDPCITIAQMIHETGNLHSFWASRPQRNPAGIGVNGATSKTQPTVDPEYWAYNPERKLWEYGISFPMWTFSIPAHVGRLLAYARTDDQLITDEQKKLVAFALSFRQLPKSLRGTVQTLRQLGGTWANPGTTYGSSLAKIANAITNT